MKLNLRLEVTTHGNDHHEEGEEKLSGTIENESMEKSEELEREVSEMEALLTRYEKMIRELNENTVTLDLMTAAGIATEVHVKMGEIGSKVLTESEIYTLCKREDERDEEGNVLSGKELSIVESYSFNE